MAWFMLARVFLVAVVIYAAILLRPIHDFWLWNLPSLLCVNHPGTRIRAEKSAELPES